MTCNHPTTTESSKTYTNPITLQQTVITTVKCDNCKKVISKTSKTYGDDPFVI